MGGAGFLITGEGLAGLEPTDGGAIGGSRGGDTVVLGLQRGDEVIAVGGLGGCCCCWVGGPDWC